MNDTTNTRLEVLEKEVGMLKSEMENLLTAFGKLMDQTKQEKAKYKKARIINPPIAPRKRGRPRKVR